MPGARYRWSQRMRKLIVLVRILTVTQSLVVAVN